MVPAERRLVELDKLLGAPAAERTRALWFLERIGAFQSLLPGSAPRERRRGIFLVGRLGTPDTRVARSLLLLPLGREKALDSLRRWKVSREELRLASRLFSIPVHGPRRTPTSRDVAAFLRLSFPFEEETAAFLRAAGDSRARALAEAAEATRRRPAALRRRVSSRLALFAAQKSLLFSA